MESTNWWGIDFCWFTTLGIPLSKERIVFRVPTLATKENLVDIEAFFLQEPFWYILALVF